MENDILFKVRMADRANHVQKDMKSDCSDREFEKMRSVM